MSPSSKRSQSGPDSPSLSRRSPAANLQRRSSLLRLSRRGSQRTHAQWHYLLAGGTVLLAVFTMAPIYRPLAEKRPALWAEIVLGVSALQLAYALWACTARDWSVARALLVVNAVVATVYATAFMLVIATPTDQTVLWGLDSVRAGARWWCPLCAALSGLLAALGGRNAHCWRFAL